MRLAALIFVALISLKATADEIAPSGPGNPQSGEPSGQCADKKNMTVINFRYKVKDKADAKYDCQMVKRSDGWHFNYFEGEDIYFNDKGEPCIKSNNKETCGAGVNNQNSWRDNDGVKRTHHTKIEYVQERSLKITFLDDNGKPDPSVPPLHLSGDKTIKESQKSSSGQTPANAPDPHDGNMRISYDNLDKPAESGSIDASSSSASSDKTPVAPDAYITPNKLDTKPNPSSSSPAKNDKTQAIDPKSVCEAQGLSGWSASVTTANEFSKESNQADQGGKLQRWDTTPPAAASDNP